ncbi:MAG: S8 family serine peptidase [Thermoflexales bacterium]|nr:S8 family serine peptidase [Thermoflexales bacterium]
MKAPARWLLALVIAVTALGQPLPAAGGPPLVRAARLAPALAEALAISAPDAQLPVLIHFVGRADLARATATLAAGDRRARATAVVGALRETAAQAERALAIQLAKAAAKRRASGARWLWINNALALRATPALIAELAARDDVTVIAPDSFRDYLPAPDPGSSAQGLAAIAARIADQTLAVNPPGDGASTWGIARIRADEVQRALGIDGSGVVVANIDTGVDWTHPALQTRYRGYGVVSDHLHNWIDTTDGEAQYPFDGHGHGTHTMGTIVGGEGIGVAPGARWMAARGLNSAGQGYDSWLLAAMQFVLAPGGEPSYAPDIVSNSWGSTDGGSTTFADAIAALQAAGILVIFSAGNSGPLAASVGSPGSNPGVPAIGATDSDDDVAWFSSRGPSLWDEIKPLVSAPGVGVISAFPGGVYRSFNGTSMAAPHVAGAAALMLSAAPGLSGPAVLETLTRTAVPLSTTLPNNNTGWGRIDAFSATLSVAQTGLFTGTVLDGGLPVGDVLITAHGDTGSSAIVASTHTDAQGRYALPVPAGLYTLTAEAYGYVTATSIPRLMVTQKVVAVSFTLSQAPMGIVYGQVTDAVSGKYVTATLTALEVGRSTTFNGNCALCGYLLRLPPGQYTLEARALGYAVLTRTVTVTLDAAPQVNFALSPTLRIALVDTGAPYYASALSYYRAALAAYGTAWDEFRVKQIPRDTPTLTTLLRYDAVVWSAPFDSPGSIGAGQALSGYLQAGRGLVLSGQDIGYWDGGWFGAQPYYDKLNVVWRSDNAQSKHLIGTGSVWAARPFTLTGGDGANNQYYPDQIDILDGDYSTALARYEAPLFPTWDTAAVLTGQCRDYRAAYLAFGLEGISRASDRNEMLATLLDALRAPRPTVGVGLAVTDGLPTEDAIGVPGETLTRVLRVRNTGEAGITRTLALSLSGNLWAGQISPSSVTLGPCQATTVTLTVSIPLTATGTTSDVVQVNAALLGNPGASGQLTLRTRTPAAVLFIDDDRWYDREVAYMEALRAAGIAFDRWSTQWMAPITPLTPQPRPSPEFLSRYRAVAWYTGYDWFAPISADETVTMTRYLQGGGRLLFSSMSALYELDVSAFSQNYLGVAAIQWNDAITSLAAEPGNPVTGRAFSTASLLPWPSGYNWNLTSSVTPIGPARVIARNASGQPAALANRGSGGWKSIFLPFPLEAVTDTQRSLLMDQIMGWLSPLGDSTLVGDREVALPGETADFTLTLRADDVLLPTGTLTRAVSVTVSVNGMDAVVPMLTSWAGGLAAGGSQVLRFAGQVPAQTPVGTPMTATARIVMPELGWAMTRQWPIRAGAPALTVSLSLSPEALRPVTQTLLTIVVSNTSALTASGSLTTALPPGLVALTPTLWLSGSGAITWTQTPDALSRLIWRGELAPGARAELRMSTTVTSYLSTLAGDPVPWLIGVRADESFGGWWGATRSLAPLVRVRYLPIVRR